MRDPGAVQALVLGDDPAAWEQLGFTVRGDAVALGGVLVRCQGGGGGIRSWVLTGEDGPPEIDGLPTAWAPPRPVPPVRHPNGAAALDHVVVFSGSRDRTAAALAAAGGDVRRRADPPAVPARMCFVRVGGVIVEVAEAGPPTRFWGLVAVVPDVDALARELGDAVGRPRDAVQPGRRIATVRPRDGLQTALAFITPRPPRP